MTNSCLTTIRPILATPNQSGWFICSERYQRPGEEENLERLMPLAEELFTTVNSYPTRIIMVSMHDAATTNTMVVGCATDWLLKKGDQLTGTSADTNVWVGTGNVGRAGTAASCVFFKYFSGLICFAQCSDVWSSSCTLTIKEHQNVRNGRTYQF